MSDENLKEIEKLKKSAQKYAAAASAKNTHRTYKAQWKKYEAWCKNFGAVPLPAKEDVLCLYIVWLAEKGRKAATIRTAVAALKHRIHSEVGEKSSPFGRVFAEVYEGTLKTIGIKQEQAPAVSNRDFWRVIRKIPDNTLEGVRDRAILMLLRATGLRRSELVALEVGSISWVPGGALLEILRGKTDQYGRGRSIYLTYAKKEKRCPLYAIQRWIAWAELKEGPLSRGVVNSDRVRSKPISDRSVANIVAKWCDKAGLKGVTPHSMRATFVTEAVRRGASGVEIREVTGHKSPAMVDRYTRKLSGKNTSATKISGMGGR